MPYHTFSFSYLLLVCCFSCVLPPNTIETEMIVGAQQHKSNARFSDNAAILLEWFCIMHLHVLGINKETEQAFVDFCYNDAKLALR